MTAMLSLISEQKNHDFLSKAVLPVVDVPAKNIALVSSATEGGIRQNESGILNSISTVPTLINILPGAECTAPVFHMNTAAPQIEYSYDKNSDESEDFFLMELTRIENEMLLAKQVTVLY